MKVKIRKKTFNEINAAARIASEIAGKDIECAGLLLDREGDEPIGRYFIILDDQHVSENHVRFEDALPIAYNLAERFELAITGMWHSHGYLQRFHSQDDDSHVNNIMIKNRQSGSSKDLVSIVINNETYAHGRPDPGNAYAERFITGLHKEKADIETAGEDIKPNYSALIPEVGKKLIYRGERLCNLERYGQVLKKYREEGINQNIKDIVTESYRDKKIRMIIEGKDTGYHARLKRIYENNEDKLASDFARILAGDYVLDGRVVQGWKERIELFNEYYNQTRPSRRCKKRLKGIIKILEGYEYARRNFEQEIAPILRIMGQEKGVPKNGKRRCGDIRNIKGRRKDNHNRNIKPNRDGSDKHTQKAKKHKKKSHKKIYSDN